MSISCKQAELSSAQWASLVTEKEAREVIAGINNALRHYYDGRQLVYEGACGQPHVVYEDVCNHFGDHWYVKLRVGDFGYSRFILTPKKEG